MPTVGAFFLGWTRVSRVLEDWDGGGGNWERGGQQGLRSKQKPGVFVHSYNCGTSETGARRSQTRGSAGLHTEALSQKKKIKTNQIKAVRQEAARPLHTDMLSSHPSQPQHSPRLIIGTRNDGCRLSLRAYVYLFLGLVRCSLLPPDRASCLSHTANPLTTIAPGASPNLSYWFSCLSLHHKNVGETQFTMSWFAYVQCLGLSVCGIWKWGGGGEEGSTGLWTHCGQRRKRGVRLYHSTTYSSETESLPESPVPIPMVQGMQVHAKGPLALYMGSGDPNPGLHVCPARALALSHFSGP